jgi:hypothetical protein
VSAHQWCYARRDAAGVVEPFFVAAPEGFESSSVTILDPYFSSAPSVTPLGKILSDLPFDVANVDVLVLRGVDVKGMTSEHGEPDLLAARLSDRVERHVALGALDFALSSTALPPLTYSQLVGSPTTRPDPTLALRSVEFRAQLHRSGAIHTSSDAHFALPSGAHADTYIRVADAFDDLLVVRRVADWLQHRLSAGSALVGDTWTTLPLFQELARRGSRLAPIQAGGRQPLDVEPGIPVLTFASYPDSDEVRRVLGSIPPLLAAHEHAKVIFILSVGSSGAVVDNFRRLSETYLRDIEVEIISLVSTSAAVDGVDSFVKIPTIRRYSVANGEECALCNEPDRAALISIDEKRYFPRIIASRRPVMITSSIAGKHRYFWEVASAQDAVRVHSDEWSTGSQRHLHIAIDVAKLLQNSTFAERVADTLAAFSPECDVLLVPEHPVTNSLINLAQQIYPSPRVIRVKRPSGLAVTAASTLDKLAPEIKAELASSLTGVRNILILDDVVIHGRTLRSIHRLVQDVIGSLSSSCQPSDDYRLRAFAVVARPESEARWIRLTDSLRQSSGQAYLQCCERLLIPGLNCPWCEERRLLDETLRWNLLRSADSPTNAVGSLQQLGINAIERRLDLISQSDRGRTPGLGNSLFLCGADANLGEREAERLTPHSLFGEQLTEAVAYAAVATAMQELRDRDRDEIADTQGLVWHWDLPRIISAYHDPLLQASFLRAARPEELLLRKDYELYDSMEEIMFGSGDGDLRQSPIVASEHAWAVLSEKYPVKLRHLILDKVIPVVNQWGGNLAAAVAVLEHSLSSQLSA